jgi:glucokinase
VTALGVDLGGTKCLGVALEGGEVVAEARVPTPKGGAALVDGMADVVAALRTQLGARSGGGADALGVGAPGLVDRRGVLQFAPNLEVDGALDLRSALEARLGLPVVVDNDATCAAWGERELGAGQGYDDMVLVTLGTGVGGGVVAGGQVLRGAHGFAGEIGHMVVDPDGPPCPCGKQGCWERFASGSGLGRLAREAVAAGDAPRLTELAGGDPEAVRGEHVSQAAADGDPGAVTVLERYAWWVALGLTNLASAIDPDAFVLGGGVAKCGDLVLDPVRAAFDELFFGRAYRPPVDIVGASLGERAGAMGAACLATTCSSG